jgi:crossover junction endodeoxyribonuclease RuvC
MSRPPPSVRILGVDPGTIHCGYGVVEISGSAAFNRPRYLECGVIELDRRRTLPERLRALASDLREVIAELRPQEVALESVFHGVNIQSALRLGHARGVIMLLAAEADLPLAEYPPATVKRAVAGHGQAQKEQVQRMICVLCGLTTTPGPDAADALAIAICHAQHRNIPRPTARTVARPV